MTLKTGKLAPENSALSLMELITFEYKKKKYSYFCFFEILLNPNFI